MNYSIKDMDGEIIVISQFTLHSSTNKGNRPSFLKASKREYALPLYQLLVNQVENDFGRKIRTGIFGSDMKVALVNDVPVTMFSSALLIAASINLFLSSVCICF